MRVLVGNASVEFQIVKNCKAAIFQVLAHRANCGDILYYDMARHDGAHRPVKTNKPLRKRDPSQTELNGGAEAPLQPSASNPEGKSGTQALTNMPVGTVEAP